MPVWGWIGIVAGAWLALSVALGLVLARMLGAIERTSTSVFDSAWADKPLTREARTPTASRIATQAGSRRDRS